MKTFVVFFIFCFLSYVQSEICFSKPGGKEKRLLLQDYSITIKIQNQVAHTQVKQVFINQFSEQINEAKYLLKKPYNAQIIQFDLNVNGKKKYGRIVERTYARYIYDREVARGNFASLLEKSNIRNEFEVSLSSIPKKSLIIVEYSYRELLKYNNRTISFSVPLAKGEVQNFDLKIEIDSVIAVEKIFSSNPSYQFDDTRGNIASLSRKKGTLPSTLAFWYILKKSDTSFHVVSHKEKGKDGYFMLLVTPNVQKKIVPQDFTFVIDVSGSMRGKKRSYALSALKFFLKKLRDYDRFNCFCYNSEVTFLVKNMVLASEENKRILIHKIQQIQASGSSNVKQMLKTLHALSHMQRGRAHSAILFTDGRAANSNREQRQQLQYLRRNWKTQSRLFIFTLGNKFQRAFIKKIVLACNGSWGFAIDSSSLHYKVDHFFDTVTCPVWSNLSFHFKNLDIFDVYPKHITHLFYGNQLVLLGKYKKGGIKKIVIQGDQYTLAKNITFSSSAKNKYVEILWGIHRINFLTEELDFSPENADRYKAEIRKLGLEYSIATNYTSFLVLHSERQWSKYLQKKERKRKRKKSRMVAKVRKAKVTTHKLRRTLKEKAFHQANFYDKSAKTFQEKRTKKRIQRADSQKLSRLSDNAKGFKAFPRAIPKNDTHNKKQVEPKRDDALELEDDETGEANSKDDGEDAGGGEEMKNTRKNLTEKAKSAQFAGVKAQDEAEESSKVAVKVKHKADLKKNMDKKKNESEKAGGFLEDFWMPKKKVSSIKKKKYDKKPFATKSPKRPMEESKPINNKSSVFKTTDDKEYFDGFSLIAIFLTLFTLLGLVTFAIIKTR